MRQCLLALLAVILLTPVLLVHAQTCGNIITPANFYEGSEEFSDPIQDCSNPFGRTGDITSLKLNNQIVTSNATYTVEETGTANYGFNDETYNNRSGADYYLHSGTDYIRVKTDFEQPTQAALEAEIPNFFNGNQIQINYYTQVFNSDNKFSYFLVSNSPRVFRLDPVDPSKRVIDVYNEMEQYLQKNAKSPRQSLLPGTYIVVQIDTDEGPGSSFEPSLLQKIFVTIIPTAHAYYYVNTVTFTLAGPTPEPQGVSSVLFLPGIQASRLYSGEPGNNRIWEPSNNTDVSSLGLTEQGISTSDIRTNDIIDETSIQYIGDNIYKDFINFMNDLVDTKKVIKEWTPLAYDWRYDVFDIAKNGTKYLDGSIKNPTDEVIRLASSSLSKKVTIIAHSNGGLLAKAIMLELKERGRDDLVDNIIFIGTPQLGTPKAIATILHGYDQEALGGLIIDDGIARNVIRNLPGAYSLLPSEKYQELVPTPLVRFDSTLATGNSLSGYGLTIDSASELNAFMNGLEDSVGRTNVGLGEVNKPIKVNSTMYFEALLNHKQKLDNWVPPTTTKVFQIVGTGLATIESIEYREITKTVCPLTAVSVLLCPKVKVLKPQARFTAYGDETVVSKSAGFVSGGLGETQKIYLDLGKIEDDRPTLIGDKKLHSNLTEIDVVQEKISDILKIASTTQFQYLSDNEPVSNKTYDMTEINSPVQLSTKDAQGRITGMVKENGILVRKEEIPSSSYIEFGTTKYLIVPADIRSTTTLSGEAWGGYTMTLSTIDSGNNQVKKHEIVNATTTPTMKVTFTKSPSAGYGVVETDLNGDGVTDSKSTVDGVNIPIVSAYSYSVLISTITALPIHKIPKDVLLALAKQAQSFHDKTTNKVLNTKLEKLTLAVLQSTITLYQRNKIISKVAADNLLVIINFLSK